jgi:hypothetical protein
MGLIFSNHIAVAIAAQQHINIIFIDVMGYCVGRVAEVDDRAQTTMQTQE